MTRIALKTNCALAFAVAGMLAAGPALAEKPSWAGGGKGDKSEQRDNAQHNKIVPRNGEIVQRNGGGRSSRNDAVPATTAREHFGDRHRTLAHEYYGEQARNGRCPPGLAKKDNGCMPPGQAKKWSVGQPLPRGLSYHYDVPPALVSQFGQPPSGYRYARVGNDIVLISPRNRTVIDVIANPGRF
jgi:Ni/Co efflux regulator RcnB